jgi:hypothetical protein
VVEIPEHLRGDGPCQRCGGDNIRWFVNNPFWNTVIAEYKDVEWQSDDPGGIYCFTCFAIIVDELGWDVPAFEMVPTWRWIRRPKKGCICATVNCINIDDRCLIHGEQ